MALAGSKKYQEDLKRTLNNCDFLFLKGKKIFVTGGLGLIGSSIVDLLLELNDILDANITIYIGDLEEAHFQEKYPVKRPDLSFLQYNSLSGFNYPFNFDFVIVAAGIANPQKYVSNPVETIMTSIQGLRDLLESGKNQPNTKYLYISSSEVYGRGKREPSEEREQLIFDINDIRSSYAIGKLACEALSKSYSKEFGEKIVIARPGHIFGPTASIHDTRISSSFCYDGVRKKPIILKTPGNSVRSYMYSLDCASAMLFLLQKGSSGEIYNIATKEKTSILDFAKYVSEAASVPLFFEKPSEEDRKTFNSMENSTLEAKKLFSLGFKESFAVKEAVKHTIDILAETLLQS